MWDNDKQSYDAFGSLKTVAGHNALTQDSRRLCFMVFDILLVNGKPMTGKPLLERRCGTFRVQMYAKEDELCMMICDAWAVFAVMIAGVC